MNHAVLAVGYGVRDKSENPSENSLYSIVVYIILLYCILLYCIIVCRLRRSGRKITHHQQNDTGMQSKHLNDKHMLAIEDHVDGSGQNITHQK